MVSALIGQPPNNELDYIIVKGIFRRLGIKGHDPSEGAHIPPFRPANYQHETRAPGIIAANCVCIVLALLFTGSRVLIRALYRGLRWGWDDWFIILGTLCAITWFALGIAMAVYGGGGKHLYDVTYVEYNWYYRIGFVKQSLYLPTAIFIKMSITLFNRRIAGLASKPWRRINDVFFVILALYLIAYSTWLGTRCPSNNKSIIDTGKDDNYKFCKRYQNIKLALALVIVHVVLGFCLLLTPVVVLWKIKMSQTKKVWLFVIFAIGSISCVGALMIVITQYQLVADVTWNYVRLQNWIFLDLIFGLIVASLPILYGQFPRTWSKFRSYTRTHSHSHSVHRNGTNPHPELMSVRKGADGGIYVHTDIECHGNTDDQVELLEQPCRPAPALTSRHQPTTRVIITGGEMDGDFTKQASYNESVESTATPPLKN